MLRLKLRQQKALLVIYLLVLTQVLYILFLPTSPKPPSQQPAAFSYAHIESLHSPINWSAVDARTTQLTAGELKSLLEYQRKKVSDHTPLLRNDFINLAILELSTGNNDLFEKHMNLARELDPNWIGWKN